MRTRIWFFPAGLLAITLLLLSGCGRSGGEQASADNVREVGAVPIESEIELAVPVSGEGELPPCCAAAAKTAAKSAVVKPEELVVEAPAAEPAIAVAEAEKELPKSTWRASPWLSPAERSEKYDLNWQVTDHDGQSLSLQSLIGRPAAVSFIYTRCPDPTMCPLTALRFADLERRLAEAGLGEQVQLWLISLDPKYDGPRELTIFAKNRNIQFTSARLFRPRIEDMEALKFEFGVTAQPQRDGSISHYTDLFIMDSQARFVRYHTGGGWDNAKVMIDLARLAGESQATAPAKGGEQARGE